MMTSMTLICKALFPSISTFETPPFFALQPQGQVTAFRADIGSEGLAVLRAHRARLHASTTMDAQYQRALTSFAAHPDPAGILLQWVCRDTVAALDLTTQRMTLTPVA
jgi:hypothetical protein